MVSAELVPTIRDSALTEVQWRRPSSERDDRNDRIGTSPAFQRAIEAAIPATGYLDHFLTHRRSVVCTTNIEIPPRAPRGFQEE